MYKPDLLTYSRFTRTLAPSEGFRFLRGAPGVTALKVPSTSDQPSPSFPKAIPLPKVLVFELVLLSNRSSPSAGRRRYPSLPKVLVLELALLGSHSSPSANRRRYPSSRKVLVFELALLSDHPTPSGMLVFLSLGPYKRVREHFRG